jgi:hypothetical protein
VKVLTVIEERKHLRKKIIDPLLFEIWIFHNGQPDWDDDRRIFVAKNKDRKLDQTFNSIFRYIDDVPSLSNSRFGDYLHASML